MENRKIKLVIADDNREFAEALYDCLADQEDIEVIGIAKDGIEALKYVNTCKPDVLLLDIIMPNLDGLGVMEKIRMLRGEKPPKVIILSAVGHEKVTQRAISLGVEYYVVKPFDMDAFVDRIRELFLSSSDSEQISGMDDFERLNNNSIISEISNALHEIGVPPHIKGYTYLREAIEMVMKDNDLLNKLTRGLYPAIADKYGSTVNRVERAIHHAIATAVRRGEEDTINELFGNPFSTGKKRLTNSMFISAVVDRLRMEKMLS